MTKHEWRVSLLEQPSDATLFGAYLDWHEEQGHNVSGLRPLHGYLVSGEKAAPIAIRQGFNAVVRSDPLGKEPQAVFRSNIHLFHFIERLM